MKKGQVTLFIILGIVIVIAVVALFALRSLSTNSKLYSESGSSVSVPTQLRPVTNLISDCIENTALDGLNLMGQQGGYVDLPQDIIPRSSLNAFSNSLYVNKNLQVAYWSYESVSGIPKQQVPTVAQMQDFLSGYVSSHLQECFSLDFDTFISQGYEINSGDKISATSTIKDNYVEVKVDYPIDIKLKDVEKKIQSHYRKVDINYGKLYNLAVDILSQENSGYFLENKTLDVMSVYDDIPTSGGSIDCTPRVWTKSEIEKNLKKYLVDNIAAIDIQGTKDTTSEKYFLVKSDKAYSDASVDFVFSESYPFYMSVNGGDNILREDSVVGRTSATSLLLGIFCLNNYNFIYDINYPVLITLSDSSNKNPSVFEFANQVVIKNNQPKENKIYVNPNVLPDTSKVCKYRNVNSTIYAVDLVSGKLLSGAQVSFDCVGATCDLGETSVENSVEPSLYTSLPQCYNGQLNVYDDNYAPAKTRVDTNSFVSSVYVILKPKYNLATDVKIIDNGVIRDLREDESYIIQFESQTDEFTSLVTGSNVDIISGDYYVRAYLMKNASDEFKTGSQKVEYCNDVPKGGLLGVIGFTDKKCFSQEIDSTTLDQIIVGGEEFAYTIDQSKLTDAKKITVYIILKDQPKNILDLKETFAKIATNANDPSFREPEIT